MDITIMDITIMDITIMVITIIMNIITITIIKILKLLNMVDICRFREMMQHRNGNKQ